MHSVLIIGLESILADPVGVLDLEGKQLMNTVPLELEGQELLNTLTITHVFEAKLHHEFLGSIYYALREIKAWCTKTGWVARSSFASSKINWASRKSHGRGAITFWNHWINLSYKPPESPNTRAVYSASHDKIFHVDGVNANLGLLLDMVGVRPATTCDMLTDTVRAG